MSYKNIIIIIIGLLASAVGSILMKKGAVLVDYQFGFYKMTETMLINGYMMSGILIYIVPTFLWVYLMKTMDVSLLLPLLSLNYVITPLMARMLLDETIPLLRYLGILIVFVGVLVISRSEV